MKRTIRPIFLAPLALAIVAGCPTEVDSIATLGDSSPTNTVVADPTGASGEADGDTAGETVVAGATETMIDPDPIAPASPTTDPAAPADPAADPDPTPEQQLAAEILELVNAQRAAAGVAPLTANAALDSAALAHAADMQDNDFFSHTGSDGQGVSHRASVAGYDWSYVGENIAYGPSAAADVMSLWMNSPGHRANILNSEFEELGVGVDLRGNPLWVQVFGRPN